MAKENINTNMKSSEDDVEIHQYMQRLHTGKEKLWLWQDKISEKDQRSVYYGVVNSVDFSKYRVIVQTYRAKEFKFDPKKKLYVYSETFSIAFLASIEQFGESVLSFSIPHKVNLIQGNLFDNIELIEKENEEKYGHMRTAKRVVADDCQQVGIIRKGTNKKEDGYFLYDMSSGGMGFLVDDPGEFDIDEDLLVVSMDEKQLKKKIRGKVVGIRKIDNELGNFKVGVKFN